MVQFLAFYWSWDNPFVYPHLAIIAFSVAAVIRWQRFIRELEKQDYGQKELTETEFEIQLLPGQKFERTFDLLASLFVLVGLTGTLFGFSQALTHITSQNYDFSEIGRGLSVSAFGIVYAIALNSIVSAISWYKLTPLVEELSKRRNLSRQVQMMARVFREHGDAMFSGLTKSLEKFTDINSTLAATVTSLADASRGIGGQFSEIETALAESAKRTRDILDKSASLPEEVQRGLREVFQDYNNLVSEMKTGVAELGSFPSGVRQELERAVSSHKVKMEEASEAWTRRFGEELKTLAERYQGGPQAAVEGLQETFSAAEKGLAKTFEKINQDLGRSIGGLAEDLAKGATLAGEILDRSAKLPDQTRENLREVLADQANLVAAMKDAVSEMRGLSPAVTAELHTAINESEKALDRVSDKWIQKFGEELKQLATTYKDAPEASIEGLRNSFSEIDKGLAQTFAKARSDFERTIQEIAHGFAPALPPRQAVKAPAHDPVPVSQNPRPDPRSNPEPPTRKPPIPEPGGPQPPHSRWRKIGRFFGFQK